MSRVLDVTQEIQGQNKTTNLDTGLSSVRHVWTSQNTNFNLFDYS